MSFYRSAFLCFFLFCSCSFHVVIIHIYIYTHTHIDLFNILLFNFAFPLFLSFIMFVCLFSFLCFIPYLAFCFGLFSVLVSFVCNCLIFLVSFAHWVTLLYFVFLGLFWFCLCVCVCVCSFVFVVTCLNLLLPFIWGLFSVSCYFVCLLVFCLF